MAIAGRKGLDQIRSQGQLGEPVDQPIGQRCCRRRRRQPLLLLLTFVSRLRLRVGWPGNTISRACLDCALKSADALCGTGRSSGPQPDDQIGQRSAGGAVCQRRRPRAASANAAGASHQRHHTNAHQRFPVLCAVDNLHSDVTSLPRNHVHRRVSACLPPAITVRRTTPSFCSGMKSWTTRPCLGSRCRYQMPFRPCTRCRRCSSVVASLLPPCVCVIALPRCPVPLPALQEGPPTRQQFRPGALTVCRCRACCTAG